MLMTPLFLTADTRRHVAQSIMSMDLSQNYRVEFKPVSKRSIEQNKLLHALLQDISRQCEWAGRKFNVTQWKRLFVAAIKEQNTAPALEGQGVVVISDNSSSALPVEAFGELIEYVQVFGNERGVIWSGPEAA